MQEIQRWRNIHPRKRGAAHAQDLGISSFPHKRRHTHTHTHTHTRTLPHSPTHAPSPLNLTLVNSQPHPSHHTTHALFLLRFIYTPTAPAPQFPFPIFSPQFTITSSGPLYCVPCEGNCVIITQTLSLKLICGLRKLNTKRGMSCNGCRVLRKGCSESCILRPCLQWIESPEAQGHATVFVAKFFGRAGLMSFISNVPEPQRPGNSLFLLKKKKKTLLSLFLPRYFLTVILCSSVSVSTVRSVWANG